MRIGSPWACRNRLTCWRWLSNSVTANDGHAAGDRGVPESGSSGSTRRKYTWPAAERVRSTISPSTHTTSPKTWASTSLTASWSAPTLQVAVSMGAQSLPSAGSLRMTSTGMWEWCTTYSEIDPITTRLNQPLPWEPTTITSTPDSSATCTII